MIGNDWDILLKDIYNDKRFINLIENVKNEYKINECYPKKEDIFNALKYTPYKNVRVLILGQDPYHGFGEAHGLAFSVQKGVKLPPSLKNIFKELHDDLGYEIPSNGELTLWAKNGVLLLNSILTVRKDTPLSHKKLGWQFFTDKIIELLNEKDDPVVFILWGNSAREKKTIITNKKHLIIESVHPSPFSARNGFFGSKPFSKTNDFLKANKMKEINFNLKELNN